MKRYVFFPDESTFAPLEGCLLVTEDDNGIRKAYLLDSIVEGAEYDGGRYVGNAKVMISSPWPWRVPVTERVNDALDKDKATASEEGPLDCTCPATDVENGPCAIHGWWDE